MSNTKTDTNIATIISNNQCEYPDAIKCPHYLELFHCCSKPSVKCNYRKTTNSQTKN